MKRYISPIVFVVAAIGLAVGPAQVLASPPPEPVHIEVVGNNVPPPFLEGEGSFCASGGVEDTGPAHFFVWLADGTGHIELRLNTREEGILIWAQTTFENPAPGTLHAEGPWVIIDGNGAYETLHGVGWIVVQGSLDTGTFTYTLDGIVVQP